MAIPDKIEVFIEANATGMKTALTDITGNIVSFVSKLNQHQIDWPSILTKTLSSTVMSYLTTSLAIGLSSALKFQNALMSSGQNASEDFQNNTGKITNSLLDISSEAGISSDQVATAFGIVNQKYKDTGTATEILNGMTDLAVDQHRNLVDIVKIMIPLFGEWGVSTVPQANEALKVMGEATKYGSITFDELASALTEGGSAMSQAGRTIGETAIELEKLTTLPGFTKESVLRTFSAIQEGVTNSGSAISQLVGGMKTAVEDAGLPGAFEAIANRLKSTSSIGATALATDMGIATKDVKAFRDSAVKYFDEIGASVDGIIKKIPEIGIQAEAAKTPSENLNTAWVRLENELSKNIIPLLSDFTAGTLDMTTKSIQYVTQFLSDVKGGFHELMSSKDVIDFLNMLVMDTSFGLVEGISRLVPLTKNETTPATVGGVPDFSKSPASIQLFLQVNPTNGPEVKRYAFDINEIMKEGSNGTSSALRLQ